MPSLTLEFSQKTPKNYVFEQIFKHSLNFEPLSPLISGLVTNLITPAYVFLIEVSLANFVLKSYFYQKLSRKTFGEGSARPPFRSGRVTSERKDFPQFFSFIVDPEARFPLTNFSLTPAKQVEPQSSPDQQY